MLHIKYVNLRATISGNFEYSLGFKFIKMKADFTAKLYNLNWDQSFVVAKKVLGNGKLDIKFKPTGESAVNFKMGQLTTDGIFKGVAMEKVLKKIDYNALKIQLRKISNLIFETLQSDLK